MKSFHLTIARLGENLFDGEALSVQLPGTEGVFTVLAHHEPLVSELAAKEIKLEAADGQHHRFDLPQGGIAEVSNNQATILI